MSTMPSPPPSPPAKPGRSLAPWVLAATVLVLYLAYVFYRLEHRRQSVGRTHRAVGNELLSIELQPLLGTDREVHLADVEGKVVLLNLWATWCPPCRSEFPRLVALAKRWEDVDDFRFLSVSCGTGDDEPEALRASTETFIRSFNVSLPVYADLNRDTRRAVLLALGETEGSLPTTLILDQQGTIRGVWQGYLHGDEKDMEALLRDLVAKPPAT